MKCHARHIYQAGVNFNYCELWFLWSHISNFIFGSVREQWSFSGIRKRFYEEECIDGVEIN